jgi:hypothetical protein
MRVFKMLQRDLATLTLKSDRWAQVFVGGIWLGMIFMALAYMVSYGRNIPLAEDWYFVAPLTHHEPNMLAWLWAQNNEHRIPLPRFILLTLLKVTHGDFRVGMVLSIFTLAIMALAMILVVQRLRGGRTHFADSFFPIALLHLGNWENLFWGWQFSFVLSAALGCAILLALVSNRLPLNPKAALVAGISLILLPLCGATGLIFVPFLALWLGYCGLLQGYRRQGKPWVSLWLVGSAAVALVFLGLYFIGYESPTWNPPNPGIKETLKTSAMFLAWGLGPAVAKSWPLSVMIAFGIFISTAVLSVIAAFSQKGPEKYRAWGILIFFGVLGLYALAVGWGRAAYVPTVGLPIRYVVLAFPFFGTAFFIWELYGEARLKKTVQMGFLLGMCLLLPFNTSTGFRKWGEWYQQGMQAIEQDLAVGDSAALLAQKHRDFLIHWWTEDQLAAAIQMLNEADMGPFASLQEVSTASEDSTVEIKK